MKMWQREIRTQLFHYQQGGVWLPLDDIMDGPSPGPRSGHSAVVINNYIFVFGGHTSQRDEGAYLVDPSLYKLNLRKMCWEVDGTELVLPSGDVEQIIRDNSSLCVIGKQASDAIIEEAKAAEEMDIGLSESENAVHGGNVENLVGPEPYGLGIPDAVENSDALHLTAMLPCARTWHSADVYQGHMFILGGCLDASAEQQFWQYEPQAGGGKWTSLPCPPRYVEGHSTIVLQNGNWNCLLVIGGGTTSPPCERDGSNHIMLFDFANEQWIDILPNIEVVSTVETELVPIPPRRRCAIAFQTHTFINNDVIISIQGGYLYGGEVLDPPFAVGISPRHSWTLKCCLPSKNSREKNFASSIDWTDMSASDITHCFTWVATKGGINLPWSEAAAASGSFGVYNCGNKNKSVHGAVVFGGYRRRHVVTSSSTPSSASSSPLRNGGANKSIKHSVDRSDRSTGHASRRGRKFSHRNNSCTDDGDVSEEEVSEATTQIVPRPSSCASPISKRHNLQRVLAESSKSSQRDIHTSHESVVDYHLAAWTCSDEDSTLLNPKFIVQNSEMQDYDSASYASQSADVKYSLFGPGRVSAGVLVRLPSQKALGRQNRLTYPHYIFLGGDDNGSLFAMQL